MIILKLLFHRVQPPLSAGVEPPAKFSKSGGGGGLTGPQVLKGVAGKEGVTFLRGVASFRLKIT